MHVSVATDPDVSIIIPIYNAELYLLRCLQSVMHQIDCDIEILCVNDGSTDGSSSLLETLACSDKRIRLFHTAHHGSSAARNLGVRHAYGRYICFVDADDFCKETMVSAYIDAITDNDADVLLSNALVYDDSRQKYDNRAFCKKITRAMSEKNTLTWFSFQNNQLFKLNPVVWGALFKRSFLLENNIQFINGVTFEDNAYFFEVMFKANKISMLPDALYIYCIGHSGAVTSIENNYFDMFTIYGYLTTLFMGHNTHWETIKKPFFVFQIRQIIIWLGKINSLSLKITFLKEAYRHLKNQHTFAYIGKTILLIFYEEFITNRNN